MKQHNRHIVQPYMLLQDTTLKELKRPSVSPAQRTQLHQFEVTSFGESMKVRLFTAMGWWLVVER